MNCKTIRPLATETGSEDRFERLFDAGNYSEVAMHGPVDDWHTYAAKGLLGNTRGGVEGLERFDSPNARFYQGVAHWIGGDEDEALRCLKRGRTGHAAALMKLIRKPKISVLAQLCSIHSHASYFLDSAARDEKFSITNIGFSDRDVRYRHNTDVRSFYNPLDPPDFYFTHVLEWHHLPYNLGEFPGPKFGHTCDFDVYLMAIRRWFPVFDGLLVSCGAEWSALSTISGRPTYTFPKCFAVKEDLPPVLGQVRQHDIFLSGSFFDPIFHEKVFFLRELAGHPNIKIKFVHGFLAEDDYIHNVRQSKMSLTFYRYSGGTVTRGIEALSLGCAALVQEDSVLTMFLSEQQGLFTYDLAKERIGSVVYRVLHNWPQFSKGLLEGAKIIRKEFSRSKVLSQYLRFLTFLASGRAQQTNYRAPMDVQQKRLIFIKGGLPLFPDVAEGLKKGQVERLKSLSAEQKQLVDYLDVARDYIIEFGQHVYYHGLSASKVHQSNVDDALELYRQAMTAFPEHLTPRFNFVRSALHYGNKDQVSEGLVLARAVILQGVEAWRVGTDEDIFTWDFHNTMLNFRGYIDSIIKNPREGLTSTQDLRRLLVASLHYYLSFYENTLEHLEQAVQLDPEFPFYSFRLALVLLNGKRNDMDLRRAEEILTWHMRNTVLMGEAHHALNGLASGTHQYQLAKEDKNLFRGLQRWDGLFPLHGLFDSIGLVKRMKCLSPSQNLARFIKKENAHATNTIPGQQSTEWFLWRRLRYWLLNRPFWAENPECYKAAKRFYYFLFRRG